MGRSFTDSWEEEPSGSSQRSFSYSQLVVADTYGKAIPISRGTREIIGQILWSTGVGQETLTQTKYIAQYPPGIEYSGFKVVPPGQGGTFKIYDGTPTYTPVTTIVTTRLFVSCALGFGAPLNPDMKAKIIRITAGSTVIYDATGENISKIKATSFTLYPGSEDQEPDPVMVKFLGEDNVPAYRGEIYAVFEELDLIQFGGQFPLIRAYIVDESDDENPQTLIYAPGVDDRQMAFDSKRGIVHWVRNDELTVVQFDALRKTLMNEMISAEVANIGALQSTLDIAEWVGPNGVLVCSPSSAANTAPIIALDALTGKQLSVFGAAGSSTNHDDDSFSSTNFFVCQKCKGRNGQDLTYVVCGGILGGIGILNMADNGELIYAGHNNTYPSMDTACRGPSEGQTAFVYTSQGLDIYRFTLDASMVDRPVDPISGTDLPVPGAIWLTIPAPYTSVVALHYYAYDQSLIVMCAGPTPAVRKYNAATKALIWSVDVASVGSTSFLRSKARLDMDQLGWCSTSSVFHIDLKTGKYTNFGTVTGQTLDPDFWYDSLSNSLMCDTSIGLIQQFIGRSIGARVPLADISLEAGIYAGLDEAEITIDNTIDDIVDGFLLENSAGTDFWVLVKTLGEAFGFTVIESGDGVHLRKKLSSTESPPDITLTYDDLATIQATPYPVNQADPFSNASIITTRKLDDELFDYVFIKYRDFDYDFGIVSAPASRSKKPGDFNISAGKKEIDITCIIMRSDEAITLAAQCLYANLSSQLQHRFRITTKYAQAEVGDIILVPVNDFDFTIKLTEVTYHFDFSISCIGENYLYDIIQSDRDGQVPIPPGPPPVPNSSSQIMMFDIPLLHPSHMPPPGSISVYYGIAGFGQAGWRKAFVFRSSNGGEFVNVGFTEREMLIGIANTELGDTTTPFAYDEINSVDVYIVNGDPTLFESLTEADWLLWFSLCVIGQPGRWEVVAPQLVEQLGGRKVRFSRFIRGMRDTYMHTGSHLAGDRVLFPYINGALRGVLEADTANGATRWFRGVGIDQEIEDALENKLVIGEQYLPWSVVAIRAIKDTGDADITISWARQSQQAMALNEDGPDTDLPATEDRTYTVKILASIGGATVRTLTATGAESLQYTAAQQATDGQPTPVNVLYLRAYQTKASGMILGRYVEQTINVE